MKEFDYVSVVELPCNFLKGCTIVPQPQCHLPPVAGPCHNYTAMWFYDVDYGGCSRFWYGGKPF